MVQTTHELSHIIAGRLIIIKRFVFSHPGHYLLCSLPLWNRSLCSQELTLCMLLGSLMLPLNPEAQGWKSSALTKESFFLSFPPTLVPPWALGLNRHFFTPSKQGSKHKNTSQGNGSLRDLPGLQQGRMPTSKEKKSNPELSLHGLESQFCSFRAQRVLNAGTEAREKPKSSGTATQGPVL